MAEKPRRTSRGRQKIEMVKMKNKKNLQVCFSKRYKGLYKKAHELCSLTGAKVTIIGFSPSDKPLSFGCPDVPSIIEKYLNFGLLSNTSPIDVFVEHARFESLQKRNEEIMALEDKLREETRRGKLIDDWSKQHEKYWWKAPVQELTINQTQQLMMNLKNLRADLKIAIENSYFRDLSGYYVPPMNFVGIFQCEVALPSSSINGGLFANGGGSLSIVGGCSSNQTVVLNETQMKSSDLYQRANINQTQMESISALNERANLDQTQMKSAALTTGVLQYAGSSRINTNVQPIVGESNSSVAPYDPMACSSPLLPFFLDGNYGHDETLFRDLFVRKN